MQNLTAIENSLIEIGKQRSQNTCYACFLPEEAYKLSLYKPSQFILIDIRNPEEIKWVGYIPNSIQLPWGITSAKIFIDSLSQLISSEKCPIFFCRSGMRSQAAATLCYKQNFPFSSNMLEGFEGDLDPSSQHRNTLNGWKYTELPWLQT